MQVPHNSFVLVADGRKMLFFRNEGDEQYPNLQVVTAAEHEDAKDGALKTDAPGSAVSGGDGSQRSSFEETDFHQQEEDRFAADTAEMLKQGALRGEYDQLIIVAPPRTLGELRKHYHKEVQQRLVGELAKDLTSHPTPDIERILCEA